MFLPGKASAEDKRFLSNLAKDLRLEISFDEYDPEEDAPAIAVSNDSTLLGDDVDLEESAQAVDRVLGKYQKAKTEDVDDEYDAEEEYSKIVKQKMDEWKRAYYKDKMHIDYDDEEQMKQLAFRYVEGLQWVLHYYYDGVASWGWFYDYHYCPKISDLRNVGDMKFNFELGKPFRPFDQLMGVLPPLSSQHIPEAYRDLMTDPASSIKDF
ncbi:hypothetical protein L7F22_015031 [Adiantum nelumboides]|nr:hypothetical protein [Adiantum nelumboides]